MPRGSRRVDEQPALREVGRRIGRRVREPDRPLVFRRRRIAIGERGAQQLGRHGEPVAPVAVGADGAPLVLLPPVVERDDGRVRHEGAGVVVLDDDRGAREDEAVVADRARVAK